MTNNVKGGQKYPEHQGKLEKDCHNTECEQTLLLPVELTYSIATTTSNTQYSNNTWTESTLGYQSRRSGSSGFAFEIVYISKSKKGSPSIGELVRFP
jgi:hypothetical protein